MGSNRTRLFSSGSCFLLILMVVGVLLIGCASIEERQVRVKDAYDNIAKTATGTVTGAIDQVKDVMELGKTMVGTVQEGVEDVKQRVDAVQEGVQKIQEGKKLIEEGIGTGDEN